MSQAHRLRASWLELTAAFAAGAALTLAFAPFDLYWVAPLALAALFLLWRGAAPRWAFVLGLAFGLGNFGFGVYWVYISIYQFGEAHVLLAAGLTLGLIAVLAVFVAATGYIAARWFPTEGPYAWIAALPALWVLTEWARGWLFSGFGWLSVGYSQTESWLFGYAPLLGVHGVGWVVLLLAGALCSTIVGATGVRRRSLVVAALLVLGGWLLLDRAWTEPRGGVHSVALVQGAVSQDLKWRPEQLAETLELYARLTVEHAGQADLVVWPEAAIPALYEQVGPFLAAMERWAEERDTALMLGILKGSGPQSFENAALMVGDPPQFYLKRHLVPFGEYFPVPGFVREWMRLQSLPYIDASPGPAKQPPFRFAEETVAVTICYEDVFPAEQLPSYPAASLMVNISNDAWFGDSIAADQHLQIARFRAAEAGRYQLRATNTGITAIIDPRGRVTARAPQFEPYTLTGVVQGFGGATPYVVWRNYPVLLGSLLVLLVVQWRVTRFKIRPGT